MGPGDFTGLAGNGARPAEKLGLDEARHGNTLGHGANPKIRMPAALEGHGRHLYALRRNLKQSGET